VSFTTVLTAEQNFLQAENSFAVAAANVPLGLTAVFRALGGGWQIRVDGNFVTAATVDQMRAHGLGQLASAHQLAATASARSSWP
jgi:hypothetical protein